MTVADNLKPGYYFDLAAMGELAAAFDESGFVWAAVKRLQDTDIVDSIARGKCEAVSGGGAAVPTQGSVAVRVADSASIGPNVVVVGEGGLVCIDDGASIAPGTVISVGSNAVYIGAGATVGPNAHLDATKGSICVGAEVRIRVGAYLRELSLIADGATVGNSCEVKTSLIGPGAEVPHFNYVGDSVLGSKAHIGAGVKLSNLKIVPGNVVVRCDGATHDTGLRKFGAILGDGVQIGCNAVTNPGTVLGKKALVYPTSNVSGVVAAGAIVKP